MNLLTAGNSVAILGVFTMLTSVSTVEANVQLSPQTQRELAAPVNCRAIVGAVDPAGSISIKPGAVYCFRVVVKADGVSLTQVSQADATLLTIRLFKERGTQDHFLYVTNGTPYPLKYRAAIRPSANIALSSTPTCPVPPNAAAIEHWPYPVVELRIDAIEVLESITNVTCD